MIRFKIVDDYTKCVYISYRINKKYNPEKIKEDFGEKYVIYSSYSSGKYFKTYDENNKKVEFTEHLGYAYLFKNLYETRQKIIEIMEKVNNKSSYFLKIAGKDLESTKLKSCCIETEIV